MKTWSETKNEIKSKGNKEKFEVLTAEKVVAIISELVDIRVEKRLTQRDVAERCGLQQAAVARIETLDCLPRIDTLIKYASALDCDIVLQKEKREQMKRVAQIAYAMQYNNCMRCEYRTLENVTR